jgi:hypothetical protein
MRPAGAPRPLGNSARILAKKEAGARTAPGRKPGETSEGPERQEERNAPEGRKRRGSPRKPPKDFKNPTKIGPIIFQIATFKALKYTQVTICFQ